MTVVTVLTSVTLVTLVTVLTLVTVMTVAKVATIVTVVTKQLCTPKNLNLPKIYPPTYLCDSSNQKNFILQKKSHKKNFTKKNFDKKNMKTKFFLKKSHNLFAKKNHATSGR